MNHLFQQFKALSIDRSLLSLADGEIDVPYFCYPANAQPIGFEGCILYCFLPEYGETVFACNPESCAKRFVYPLARNFGDFLRLVAACESANPVEQIVWMSEAQFNQHLQQERQDAPEGRAEALRTMMDALGIAPMERPYEYVRAVQESSLALG